MGRRKGETSAIRTRIWGGYNWAMDVLVQCGQAAPDFSLPDVEGVLHRLTDFRRRITLLNFWSAECPWVERSDRELSSQLHIWGEAVAMLSIAANANESIELIRRVAWERNLPLLLHDQNQVVADLYGAQTTPHLFVVDPQGILRYQGSFNDVTFRKRVPSRHYLKEAVEALMAGKLPEHKQTPPYGCSIVRFV
jgi:peroxiredoxin